MAAAVRKVFAFDSVSVDALQRGGLEHLAAVLDDHQTPRSLHLPRGRSVQKNGTPKRGRSAVRNMNLFYRLATGAELVKNLTPGTLHQCLTQLPDLPLAQLVQIRLAQPDFRDVPDSLLDHSRFMREVDQWIYQHLVDAATTRCEMTTDRPRKGQPPFPAISEKAKRRLGHDIVLILGLITQLRSTVDATSWWRVVTEFPASCGRGTSSSRAGGDPPNHQRPALGCSATAKPPSRTCRMPPLPPKATRRKSPPQPTAPVSELQAALARRRLASEGRRGRIPHSAPVCSDVPQDAGTSHLLSERIARGRRSLEAARSHSVEAACRTLERAGTSLFDVFLKIPDICLTSQRPPDVPIYVCQNTDDWVKCQTLPAGPSTALAAASHLSCDIFRADPAVPLSQFLRPSDATSAVRVELERKVRSMSRRPATAVPTATTPPPAPPPREATAASQPPAVLASGQQRAVEHAGRPTAPQPTIASATLASAAAFLPGASLIQGLLSLWRPQRESATPEDDHASADEGKALRQQETQGPELPSDPASTPTVQARRQQFEALCRANHEGGPPRGGRCPRSSDKPPRRYGTEGSLTEGKMRRDASSHGQWTKRFEEGTTTGLRPVETRCLDFRTGAVPSALQQQPSALTRSPANAPRSVTASHVERPSHTTPAAKPLLLGHTESRNPLRWASSARSLVNSVFSLND